MRLAQEFAQARDAVFLFQSPERNRIRDRQLHALVVAWRMALNAAARMEQHLALFRRHRIGRLQGKVVLLQR